MTAWKTRGTDFVSSSAEADLSFVWFGNQMKCQCFSPLKTLHWVAGSTFAHTVAVLGSLAATVMFLSFARSLCPSVDNLSGGVHLNLSHLLPHYRNKIS